MDINDYDLQACLQYNPQPFMGEDIEKVLAVIEGANDERDWHWVLKLNNDRYVYLRGGCDYTGWDCQSWADCRFLGPDMPLHLAANELKNYDNDYLSTVVELQRQLKEGKDQTWQESKQDEFGSYKRLDL